jgi:hypothetical protein
MAGCPNHVFPTAMAYLGVTMAMVVHVLEKTKLECAQDCTGFAPDMQDCTNCIVVCYPTRVLPVQAGAVHIGPAYPDAQPAETALEEGAVEASTSKASYQKGWMGKPDRQLFNARYIKTGSDNFLTLHRYASTNCPTVQSHQGEVHQGDEQTCYRYDYQCMHSIHTECQMG